MEAYIIEAVRTPRGIGKRGNSALAHLHPQHLAPTVLRALKERNDFDTSDVDDIIWSTSTQRGLRGGIRGRMAALAAGYYVRASGITLDRLCGGGITSVSLAAAQIMSGMEDLVMAGGTKMMSYAGALTAKDQPEGKPSTLMGSHNAHLDAATRSSIRVLRRRDRQL